MNENPNQDAPPSKARNPYTLWFVVIAFVAPVLLAYFIFYFVNVSGFNNHGELLKPMVQVTDLKLKDQDNKLVPADKLTYKWRFITFVNASCDQSCMDRLIETRQVHKALGKNQHRVIQVIVELAEPDAELTNFIKNELGDALILKADPATTLPLLPASKSPVENQIYIQDPMGNIMMRFNQDQPIDDFHYDVRKLLKASQIG